MARGETVAPSKRVAAAAGAGDQSEDGREDERGVEADGWWRIVQLGKRGARALGAGGLERAVKV